MRRAIINRTMKTVCGKTITYTQVEGDLPKPHSLEGPAIIYPESDGLAPEYYINGIKYSKTAWESLVSVTKASLAGDPINFEL